MLPFQQYPEFLCTCSFSILRTRFRGARASWRLFFFMELEESFTRVKPHSKQLLCGGLSDPKKNTAWISDGSFDCWSGCRCYREFRHGLYVGEDVRSQEA